MLEYDRNRAQLWKDRDTGTIVVYELRDDSIVVHSVVGDAAVAIEWAEQQGKPIVALGRPGWARKLRYRRGWKVEEACILHYDHESEV